MVGRMKYLVRVQCQPSASDHEEQIPRSLQENFNVTGWHCAGPELTLEIRSSHTLAYGVFKDLADQVKLSLAQHHLRLLSGAVFRVQRHPLSAALNALIPASAGTLGSGGKAAGGFSWAKLVQRAVGGLLGGDRLTPEMFFYGEVSIDLVLSARARRLWVPAAQEAN